MLDTRKRVPSLFHLASAIWHLASRIFLSMHPPFRSSIAGP